MCEINWEIVQKFVCCLVWPIIVLVLFLIFKKQLTKLVDRIVNESSAIEIFGLKFQLKQIEKLKEDISSGQSPTTEQAKNIIFATVALQIDSLKKFGEEYLHSTFDQRRIIETRINEYSVGLTTNDLLPLIESDNTGHRIAAAMALEPILYRAKVDPADVPVLKEFIQKSLKDRSSFLRYECLQLVFDSNKLKVEFRTQLEEMKLNDKNSAIRNILKLFIK
jgi:hypothetical protein